MRDKIIIKRRRRKKVAYDFANRNNNNSTAKKPIHDVWSSYGLLHNATRRQTAVTVPSSSAVQHVAATTTFKLTPTVVACECDQW